MEFPRASGILLHVTSLPSEYGIGDLGPDSFRFVDFLQAAGQSIWQILPLGPTLRGNSPYSCYSAFAANPLLISPRRLVDDGWLSEKDLHRGLGTDPASRFSASEVDYSAVTEFKWALLQRAFDRFDETSEDGQLHELERFCDLHRNWLDDFALFAALMKHFGTDQWCHWKTELVGREPEALASWRERLARQFRFEQFVQFLLFKQWAGLKAYAHQCGVRLFGDMPIFVAHGSADVWAHQDLFWLDQQGQPTVVAGVPPDYFSSTGQLWGNPLYRWDRLKEHDYRWWTQRFRAAFDMFDMLRIDHFRGFEAYWEVPAKAKTAISGKWVKGPGAEPFHYATAEIGDLPIIAEDLGLITEEVHQLRDELGYPGMRVLQFGFDDEQDDYHRPESYPENSVAYTGTHDNQTLISWHRDRKSRKRSGGDILDRYLAPGSSQPVHIQLIELVLNSAAQSVVIPMQDLLGLDNSARMNTPGQAEGNWRWRVTYDQLSSDVQHQLHSLAASADRC
jgi:4-alpha-glucanotransferase